MSRSMRCLWIVAACSLVAACTGTETDNPTADDKVPSYRSPASFGTDTAVPPGCPPPPDSGKPRRLPLWGRDGTIVAGADPYHGMRVIDASIADHPRVLSEVALSGEPRTLLVHADALTLAIAEVPSLHQDSVPEPATLEPVTRLVRYDLADPSAPVRAGEVDVEGELWSVQERGELTWVMSAKTSEPLSCDLTPASCGYVNREALVLTAYRYAQGAWSVAQRVELRMNERAWSTPEGFAAFEATADAEASSTGGFLRAVRFGADGMLGDPVEIQLPPQLAWQAPLSLASDQARVFLQDPHDGSVELAIYDLASGEQLSLLRGIGNQAGPSTRFGAHTVYVSNDASQQVAVLVDTSDPRAPIATSFPAPISRVVPLDADGTRLLGISTGSVADGFALSLLHRQERVLQVIDSVAPAESVDMTDPNALWIDGAHVFFGYQRRNGSFALGLLDVGESTLTPIAITAEGYADDLLPMPDVAYLPDPFGLQVVALGDGAGSTRVDWGSEVDAVAIGTNGGRELALVQRAGGPIMLEIGDGAGAQRFEVSPGARMLAARGDRALVISSEPKQQCEQTGRDCSDYAPNVEVYALGASPKLLAKLPLPDAGLVANADDRQVRLDWDSVWPQGQPIDDGRFLFVAELDATCLSDAACKELGITGQPIGQAGVNVALPGTPAPCPPGATQCDQSEPPPAPTVYGETRSRRFYVLDARRQEPTFGAVGESVLERGASQFGAPVISEGRVLATRIERDPQRITPGASGVEDNLATFMLDRFEVGDDGSLTKLPALNVPGYPLALRDDGALLITAEPDAKQQGAAIMYALALSETGARVVGQLALPGRYDQVTVDGDRAYYLRAEGKGCTGKSALAAIELPKDSQGKLSAGDELVVPGVDWRIGDVRDGRLLLTSGGQRFSVIGTGEKLELQTFVCGGDYLDAPQLNGDEIVGAGALWGKVRIEL